MDPEAAGGSPVSDLLAEMDAAGDWVSRFHRNGGAGQHLKVAKEAAEFAQAPSLEEAADILISFSGSARLEGWDWPSLAQAVRDKMAINRARTWAQLDDGTWQHAD